MKPLFSLLTASYNNGVYLEDWYQSVITQLYRPLEVVFVNDCSTDNTDALIKEYIPKLEDNGISIKFISNPVRLCYAGSLQTSWQNASGTFFGVLDSDDQLCNDAVTYIMNLYDQFKNIGYIYTQFVIYDQFMKKIKGNGFSCGPKHSKESLLDLGLRKKHGFSHWRTFSTRVPNLHKIFKPGLRSAVDKFMGYRLEEFSPGMFVDKVFYKYRGWVPGCISLTEKPKESWRQVMSEAQARRKQYKYTPFPVTIFKG